jgi:hypothetical protein
VKRYEHKLLSKFIVSDVSVRWFQQFIEFVKPTTENNCFCCLMVIPPTKKNTVAIELAQASATKWADHTQITTS